MCQIAILVAYWLSNLKIKDFQLFPEFIFACHWKLSLDKSGVYSLFEVGDAGGRVPQAGLMRLYLLLESTDAALPVFRRRQRALAVPLRYQQDRIQGMGFSGASGHVVYPIVASLACKR